MNILLLLSEIIQISIFISSVILLYQKKSRLSLYYMLMQFLLTTLLIIPNYYIISLLNYILIFILIYLYLDSRDQLGFYLIIINSISFGIVLTQIQISNYIMLANSFLIYYYHFNKIKLEFNGYYKINFMLMGIFLIFLILSQIMILFSLNAVSYFILLSSFLAYLGYTRPNWIFH